MRRFKNFVVVIALFSSEFLFASSNRVFVSTTGSNANDCSNPLTPCLDFTGALSQVNAGGEIIAMATGPYGPLNITKAVTISGPPGVVIYSGHQVNVNAPGAVVVLRGLTIDGNGANEVGISVAAIGSLYIESVVIANFAEGGIDFVASGQLFVKDTVVRGNSNIAINLAPNPGSAHASVDHCRLENNVAGFECGAGASATIRKSVLSGQTGVGGIGAGALGGELNVESCVVSNNPIGIVSAGGATVRVSNTTVTDNGTGIDEDGGSLLSRGNNTLEGNGTNGTFTGTFSSK
jgi:hypothetical protein